MFQQTTQINDLCNKKIGENGHCEYSWIDSKYTKELIVQFNYQLVRTNDSEQIQYLESILRDIITQLQDSLEYGKLLPSEFKEQIIMLYKLIGYTRDIIDGKGEYILAFMQILVWYDFYPELAKKALKSFVLLNDDEHPYGSWKDIKYFCNYCKKNLKNGSEHPLVEYSIKLVNHQLLNDYLQTNKYELTLVSKWIPREKSNKFSWLFKKMAYDYFSNYLTTANNMEQMIRARNKCLMDYRKIIATLNKNLETVQINQCDNKWSTIEPNRITSKTLYKQRKAFFNIKPETNYMRVMNSDRYVCSQQIINYIQTSVSGEIKGKHVYLNEYVKTAIELIQNWNQYEVDLLNSMWSNNSNENVRLAPMIAMVDTSLSMYCSEIFYTALGLGIRVAEKTLLGKQMMTFGKKSKWHNLESYSNFVDMVKAITCKDESSDFSICKENNINIGEFSNLYDGLNTLLEVIHETKMSAKDVKDLNLIIFSDMQIIKEENMDEFSTLYESIKKKYEETGMKTINRPYALPHIIFWNMKSTDGFPALSIYPNISMISGNNPKMLNLYSDKNYIGNSGVYSPTPYTKLIEILNNKRYKILEEEIENTLL